MLDGLTSPHFRPPYEKRLRLFVRRSPHKAVRSPLLKALAGTHRFSLLEANLSSLRINFGLSTAALNESVM